MLGFERRRRPSLLRPQSRRYVIRTARVGLSCVALLLLALGTGSAAPTITTLPTATPLHVAPSGLAYDANGDLFIADRAANRILILRPNGVPSVFAGSNTGQSGYVDGDAGAARFNAPVGVAVGAQGQLYVTDSRNHVVRVVAPSGAVATFAGTTNAGHVDGPKAQAQFVEPTAIAADGQGNIFVVDGANRVRKIDSAGNVTTLPVIFHQPNGIAIGESFTIFISDRAGIVTCREDLTGFRRFSNRSPRAADSEIMQGDRPIGTPLAVVAIDAESVLYTAADRSIHYLDVAQRFDRVAVTNATASRPTAIAIATDGTVAIASASGAIAAVRNVDLRRPVMPGEAGALPNHFAVNHADYNIAYVGSSFVWWDTGWDDSIEGLLERELRNDPSAQRVNPHVIPVVMPAGTLKAAEEFTQYLGSLGMVRLVVFQISRTAVAQSYGIPVTSVVARSSQWEPSVLTQMTNLRDELALANIRFIVVVNPEEPEMAGTTRGLPFLASDLARRRVATINLYPDFMRAQRSIKLFGLKDQHFLVGGRRVEAAAVGQYLKHLRPWGSPNQPAAAKGAGSHPALGSGIPSTFARKA